MDKAYLIYLEDALLLSKKKYSNWYEIQDEYCKKFKTSLVPMTYEEIISFFTDDFGEERNWPFSNKIIQDFFSGEMITISSSYGA